MTRFFTGSVVLGSIFAFSFSDKLCFDTYCFTLPTMTINPILLSKCTCGLQLIAVKELTHIKKIDPESCTTIFSNADGSKNVTLISLKGPQYDPLPEVLHEDGIPAFPSLNAMNKTCSEINFWGRPQGGGYFIWDFKGPLIMSRVEFRNHYHYSHYRGLISFEVSVSQSAGINASWTKVLHVDNLETPTTNCGPILHYTFNRIVARQVKFTALSFSGPGPVMSYFRVY